MQAWKNVRKTIRDTLAERLRTSDKKHGDLLDLIVEELHCKEPLINEDFAVDMVSTLLFASIYTLAAIIAIAFKSLHDNPEVVHALKVCCILLHTPLVCNTTSLYGCQERSKVQAFTLLKDLPQKILGS